MSWPALKWMLMKRLPAPQKSTGITLARRQPEDLRPFADAAATLADEAGLSLSGFKLAVAALEAKGLVAVIRNANRPNLYDLKLTVASHDVTSHEVTTHDVTGDEVTGHQSRGDGPASHEVTTNKHTDKQVKTNKKTKAPQAVEVPFDLPVWIDQRAWTGYEEMRRKKRAGMTPSIRALVLKHLLEFAAKGHDPNAILDASTRSNWTDVYEPKTGGASGNYKSKTERTIDAAREASDILRARREGRQSVGDAGEAGDPPAGDPGYGNTLRLC